MTFSRTLAIALIGLHVALNVWHGAAHLIIPVPVGHWELAYVLLVIWGFPLIALLYLWRKQLLQGSMWMLAAMAGALIFEALNHYVIDGSDHVRNLPHHPWRNDFQISAFWLNIIDGLGVAVALIILLSRHQLRAGQPDNEPLSSEARMAPIERPAKWLLRIAYAVSRQQFGCVIAPLRVIYARKPALLILAALADHIQQRRLTLDAQWVLLIQAFTAMQNNCPFCEDITLARALAQGIGKEKFEALSSYPNNSVWSDAELAVFKYLDEYNQHRVVSDETYHQLRAHFDEQKIIEITWLNALEQYHNALAKPLGLQSDQLARREAIPRSSRVLPDEIA